MKHRHQQSFAFKSVLKYSIYSLFAILLIGCSGIKVSTGYNKSVDFKAYKTYGFTTSIEDLMMNPDNKDLLKGEIERELDTRGYRIANSLDADLLIDVLIKQDRQNKTSQSVSNNRTMNTNAYWYGYNLSSFDFASEQEGTLKIDIIDRSKNETVWLGVVSAAIDASAPSTEKEKKIVAAIVKVFSKYPLEIIK